MKLRSLLDVVGATALALSLAAIPAAAAGDAARGAADRQRVVVQVSDGDPAKWNLALNNVNNIQTDLGAANVDIELVAYGPGIGMLKAGSPVASRIDEALTAGVKVAACENTMRNSRLVKGEMQAGLSYVASGVIEIMMKQREGWSYLRP